MANLRLQLRHYRYYLDLQKEEPTHKRIRFGTTLVMVVALLLAFFMFVLGLLSNDLAQNPSNVLEPPQAGMEQAPFEFDEQQMQQFMEQESGGLEIPMEGTEGLPPGVMDTEGMTPRLEPGVDTQAALWDTYAPFLAAGEGEMLAQEGPSPINVATQPAEPSIDVSAPQIEFTAPQPEVSTPAPTEQPSVTEPSKQTSGVGNLSNLADKISGRGFQLYLLVLFIAFSVVAYIVIKRARQEGKSK